MAAKAPGGHHRHVEPDDQTGASGRAASRLAHDLGRLADDVAAALAADGPADAREQQPQVVVDLGRGPDRGSRVADRVLLPDGDGRTRCPPSLSTSGFSIRSRNWRARPTATRRSGAGPRRRSCRRRATICPTRSRPVTTMRLRAGSVRSMFFRLCVRAPRTTMSRTAGLGVSDMCWVCGPGAGTTLGPSAAPGIFHRSPGRRDLQPRGTAGGMTGRDTLRRQG